MAKRSPRERLLDIAECIEKIERFLASHSYEVFRTNALIHDAVLRNLEIISEASRHVPDELKAKEPGIPWREIRDFGNVLRHTYEGVNDPILWRTIEDDLPVLSAAVQRLLGEAE